MSMLSIVGIFVLLSFSAISGENDKLSKDVTDILREIFGEHVPQFGANDETDGLTLTKQLSKLKTGEDTVRLGKSVEKPNEKRNTIDWIRSKTEMKNADASESCCTGMWGRSFRKPKFGSLKKSAVDGLTSISGLPKRKKRAIMLEKSLQPNNPRHYRKVSSKKLN